jgi:hypothetical protein
LENKLIIIILIHLNTPIVSRQQLPIHSMLVVQLQIVSTTSHSKTVYHLNIKYTHTYNIWIKNIYFFLNNLSYSSIYVQSSHKPIAPWTHSTCSARKGDQPSSVVLLYQSMPVLVKALLFADLPISLFIQWIVILNHSCITGYHRILWLRARRNTTQMQSHCQELKSCQILALLTSQWC